MSNQSWINVDESLPEDLQKVDILINGARRVVDATYMDNKFFVFPPICKEHWTEVKNNVTHWMPIPTLPTEGARS